MKAKDADTERISSAECRGERSERREDTERSTVVTREV